jgi:iron complex transport system substrate-binding protein
MNKFKNISFHYGLFFIILLLLVITVNGYSRNNQFPITLIDDSGVEVVISEKPERIVSAAPSNTEIIFKLGLERKLVGRSEFCNFPEKAKDIESIGKMSPLNLEKIVSLNPDLILSYGGFQLKDIPRLRELGFKVLVVQSETLQEMIQGIQLIANACGIPEEGEQLTSLMQERIDWINFLVMASSKQKPKVFVGSNFDTIYSPGRKTLFHELITIAGGENIVGHLQGWAKINPELVAQKEPDIIIIPSGIMNPEEISKIKKDIITHPGWSHVPAIKNNRIYAVNEDLFYRAGPRLVDGLELLYEIFTGKK